MTNSSHGVVLIHGGTHTSSCWSRLVASSRHPMLAIDLPGRGDRLRQLSALRIDDFVDAIEQAVLESRWEKIVLVAHSMSGMTAPHAAARLGQRVRHLVMLAPVIPDDGRSAVDMTPAGLRTYLRRRFTRAAVDDGGVLSIPRPLAALLFGNGLDRATRREMLDNLVPDAPRPMIEPFHWPTLPAHIGLTYLGPRRDRAFPPRMQRRMARSLGAEFIEVPGGHEMMYSHADRLAAELDRIGDAVFA